MACAHMKNVIEHFLDEVVLAQLRSKYWPEKRGIDWAATGRVHPLNQAERVIAGKPYGVPEKEFYKGQNQPVSEVDVLSTWKEDLYMILADFREDESATIKVYVNPMVSWMWTGGWIIAFGSMISMWPDRLEQRRRYL